MSAEVPVYCLVEFTDAKWVEVSAVTLAEAERKAEAMLGVIRVVESTYDETRAALVKSFKEGE